MPNCAPAVQQAAAEVREILRKLARQEARSAEDGLTVEDGTITAADGKTITYWDLVTGKELEVEATGKAPLLPISSTVSSASHIPRIDIPAKMTGEAIFVQDMKIRTAPVFGAIVRPPTYKAKLASVDLAPIEAMPGVLKVVRNGSFLGVVAERQDQAWAAAAALSAAAKWDVKSVLPGERGHLRVAADHRSRGKGVDEHRPLRRCRRRPRPSRPPTPALSHARIDRHVRGDRAAARTVR